MQARRPSPRETPSTRSPAHFDSPHSRSFGHLRPRPAAPRSPAAARERHSGDETELRRERGRAWMNQQGAGVKAAPGRDPPSSTPAPPGALLLGDDPQAAGIAGERPPPRLLVGRVRSSEPDDAPGGQALQPSGRAQNSDFAAAIAASVSGEGANMNRTISSAATPSTIRATGPVRSNGLAGSSKYISLTMRK